MLKERPVWAALDVYETEPLPMDSPLRDCERVLLMPHAAGPTADRRYAVTSYVLDDMERFLNGENLDCEIDLLLRLRKCMGNITGSFFSLYSQSHCLLFFCFK